MKYIRKRSIKLRRIAARRLRAIRKQLRAIDLSLTISINLGFLKVGITIKRRGSATRRGGRQPPYPSGHMRRSAAIPSVMAGPLGT